MTSFKMWCISFFSDGALWWISQITTLLTYETFEKYKQTLKRHQIYYHDFDCVLRVPCKALARLNVQLSSLKTVLILKKQMTDT